MSWHLQLGRPAALHRCRTVHLTDGDDLLLPRLQKLRQVPSSHPPPVPSYELSKYVNARMLPIVIVISKPIKRPFTA